MKSKSPITNYLILLSAFCFTLQSCAEKEANLKDEPTLQKEVKGSFMSMTPTQVPKLLAPSLLASSLQEYNGTFNTTGDEFYFTTNTPSQGIISYTKLGKDGKWIQPRVAEFSGMYSEYDPIFSPDGSKLYFSSERPISDKDDNAQTHIWYVEKEGEQWSEAKYVDLKEHGNYYNSLTHSGTIYFNIWNNGDMYKAVPKGEGYTVKKLSDKLNSDNGEGDPFISPDEDYIIFRGYNNSLGNGDLYISYNINNEWTDPENLGEPINSSYHEMCPYVTTDGKYFIFSSSRMDQKYTSTKNIEVKSLRSKHQSYDNGELNIYYISSDFIEEGKTKYLKNK